MSEMMTLNEPDRVQRRPLMSLRQMRERLKAVEPKLKADRPPRAQ